MRVYINMCGCVRTCASKAKLSKESPPTKLYVLIEFCESMPDSVVRTREEVSGRPEN